MAAEHLDDQSAPVPVANHSDFAGPGLAQCHRPLVRPSLPPIHEQGQRIRRIVPQDFTGFVVQHYIIAALII
jgi:hypothetical protein